MKGTQALLSIDRESNKQARAHQQRKSIANNEKKGSLIISNPKAERREGSERVKTIGYVGEAFFRVGAISSKERLGERK